MTRSNLAKDEAFGIIPILQQTDAYQFLLIQHHAGHWGFPKGHADPGESALQTACREFEEETGITNYDLLKDLSFSEQYNFHRNGTMFEKTVLYYPAFVQSATVKYQRAEIRAYAWGDYDATIARLSFNGAKQILTDVYQYLTTSNP